MFVSKLVSESVCKIAVHKSPCKDWNVQCKLVAILFWNGIELMNFGLEACYWVMAWFTHLDGCCPQSRVQWRTNLPQQAAYQHDSSICTTNHTVTWVKSREQDCQSYTDLVAYLSIPLTMCSWRRDLIWHSPMPLCYDYASVRMRQRHTVVSLCVSHSVILYVCNSVFSEVAIN